MTTPPKLKPCPFHKPRGHDVCVGGETVGLNNFRWIYYGCCTCGARGPIRRTLKAAEKAWNTRTRGAKDE